MDTMTSRGAKASRMYQIMSELRHIMAFVLEMAHGHLSAKDKAAIRLTAFESYNLVSSQLRETALDKSAQARQRAALVGLCFDWTV